MTHIVVMADLMGFNVMPDRPQTSIPNSDMSGVCIHLTRTEWNILYTYFYIFSLEHLKEISLDFCLVVLKGFDRSSFWAVT